MRIIQPTLDWLTRAPVVLANMIAAMILFAGYFPALYILELRLLEFTWDGMGSQRLIEDMTPNKRSWQYWTTLILAPTLPFVSGAYYAGITARFAGRWRFWAILPVLVAMLSMLSLGGIHILALHGYNSGLSVKSWISPVHSAAWAVTFVLAYGLWLPEVWRWWRNRRANTAL